MAVAVAKPASHGSGNRLFAYKVADREKGDGSFFTGRGNDGQLGSALLQIKNGVSFASLGKEGLVCLQLDDPSPQPGTREKGLRIECWLFWIGHDRGLFSAALLRELP